MRFLHYSSFRSKNSYMPYLIKICKNQNTVFHFCRYNNCWMFGLIHWTVWIYWINEIDLLADTVGICSIEYRVCNSLGSRMSQAGSLLQTQE